MRMMADNDDPKDIIKDRIGDGGLLLFKYGPGTGGDVLLKQLMGPSFENNNMIYISTHETESELSEQFMRMKDQPHLEMISLMDDISASLESVRKKDRFREEGIMVTDLLELASISESNRKKVDSGQRMLSRITSIFMKQVLPFNLVIDSISDLAYWTSQEEVVKRMWILGSIVRERGGFCYVAAPLEWDGFDGMEISMFDAVLEMRADNSTGVWKRSLLLKNLKGNPSPPEEWEINVIKDIPEARSLD